MRIETEVKTQLETTTASHNHSKLIDAAQQFEGMLLQEMLKPMQSGEASWRDEENDRDAAAETMRSFGTEAVATAIAKRGGLGIAKKVMQQVSSEALQQRAKSTQY